jgi:hypothetical protein
VAALIDQSRRVHFARRDRWENASTRPSGARYICKSHYSVRFPSQNGSLRALRLIDGNGLRAPRGRGAPRGRTGENGDAARTDDGHSLVPCTEGKGPERIGGQGHPVSSPLFRSPPWLAPASPCYTHEQGASLLPRTSWQSHSTHHQREVAWLTVSFSRDDSRSELRRGPSCSTGNG